MGTRTPQHLTSLVAAEDAEIVAAALQTLAVFVRKPLQSLRGVRWQGDPALNARLFALSQGPGTKEEVFCFHCHNLLCLPLAQRTILTGVAEILFWEGISHVCDLFSCNISSIFAPF